MVIKWNELRDAREKLGLTQEQLAERLGVATRTITNWEKNGVPRKAEYKVERLFGEKLQRSDSPESIEEQLAQLDRVEKMSASERMDYEGWTGPRVLIADASDDQLLDELLRRAHRRELISTRRAMSALREHPGYSRIPDVPASEEDIEMREPRTTLGLAADEGTKAINQPHAD